MKRNRFFVLFICAFSLFSLQAQDVMLQGFYWNYPYLIGIKRWGQDFKAKLPELHDAGFTYIWMPPLSRSSADQSSVGYDVQDYYDLGGYNLGATRFGTSKDVKACVDYMKANNMNPVGDIIYNHRAGGAPEVNPMVAGWIKNYTSTKVNSGDQPYPSDRFRNYLAIGGTSGNNAGTYYVKIRSASQHSNFYGKPYTVKMWTNKARLASDTLGDSWEVEPNNGGSCGDTSNGYKLGMRKFCTVDGAGCGIDEFRINLDSTNFNLAGDTLHISLTNTNASSLGDMSDQYVYGLWNAAASTDVQPQVQYETYTDFTHLPSGQGAMTKANFKPNGNPTQLSGDIDAMYFFYDIDHAVPSSQTALKEYTKFMFDSAGITGMRLDAVKHFPTWFTGQALDYLHQNGIDPKLVVGESFDYNPSVLKGWVSSVESNMQTATKAAIKVKVFDFSLRMAVKSACDQFGYDVRSVFQSGIADAGGGSGYDAVTFVNNHDFRNPGEPVQNNPELAYAYILTNNRVGLPTVFYPDYFLSSNTLKGKIKGLIKAQAKYIAGSNNVDYLSRYSTPYGQYFAKGYANTTLVYQAQNPNTLKDVVMAINFAGDTLDLYQHLNMTNLTSTDKFTSIFGNTPTVLNDITVNNELHIVVPPRSFAMYVKGNLTDSLISLTDTLAKSVGIENIALPNAKNVTVFPNPINKNFTVDLGEKVNADVEIEMIDLTGKVVYFEVRKNVQTNLLTITPRELAKGNYLVNIRTEGKIFSAKALKE